MLINIKMPSNYATLKNTYKSYNDSKLGDTPPGWWGIIGSNKDQATIVNPGSAHSTAGTCNDFSSSWTTALDVEQPAIQYYYDESSNPGTLTCKTIQSGPNRTATITCSGTECCGGTGLNGLIPAGISFTGMVRPADTSKPQCVATSTPQPTSWFCSDPATRTCTKQVTASGKQQGCAAQVGEPSGTGSEADCVKTCYNPIKGKCVGDVGYCNDLPPTDNVSCGPDAVSEGRKCHKAIFKGMSCGCSAVQSGVHDYGNGVVGCQGDDGFEKRDYDQVTCLTGTGKIIDWGFLGMGGQVACK